MACNWNMGGNIGKIPYWRTYQGEKKKIKRKNEQKPTWRLTMGEKMKIWRKNGKKTYWRTYQGEKSEN